MGLFSRLFGGGNTQTRSVDVDPRFQNFLDTNLDQADNAFTGFNAFGPATDRIADFNQDELSAFDQFRGISNQQGLASRVGDESLSRFLSAPTLEDLRPYTDPFIDSVVDRSSQRVFDAYDQRITNLRQQSANQGSFGGSRFAVGEANLIEDLGQEVGDIAYRGFSDAFNTGFDRFHNTALQGLGAAGQSQAQDIERAQILQQTGGVQRALDQSRRDFDFSEFLRQEDTNRRDVLSRVNIQQAYPTDLFTQTTEQRQSPSLFNTIAGIAGGIAGIPGLSNIFNRDGDGGGDGSVFGSPTARGGVDVLAGGVPSGVEIFGLNNTFRPVGAFAEGGVVSSDKSEQSIPEYYLNQEPRVVRDAIFEDTGEITDIPDIGPKEQSIPEYYHNQEPRVVRDAIFEDTGELTPFAEVRNPIVKELQPANPFGSAVPTPRLKPANSSLNTTKTPQNPFSDINVTGPIRRPENPFAGGNNNAKQEEDTRNFRQKWLDNPFTQLGLTLLAGESNPLGKSAGLLLEQRSGELAEQKRAQEAQEREAIARDIEQRRLVQQRALAEQELAQKEAQARLEVSEALKDRESKERIARLYSSNNKSKGSRPEDNPVIESLRKTRSELYDLLRATDSAISNTLPNEDETKASLEQQKENLLTRIRIIESQEESLLGVNLGVNNEASAGPKSSIDPSDPAGLGDELAAFLNKKGN